MHSGNLQGGFRFMALNIGNKIVRRISGVIPMPDTVITRVNTLVSKQPKQLVFTDRHRRPISDVKFSGVDLLDADLIEIPGVDSMDVDNIEIPGVNMDIQEPQVICVSYPDIPPTDPSYIELAPVHQVAAEVEPMPSIQQV